MGSVSCYTPRGERGQWRGSMTESQRQDRRRRREGEKRNVGTTGGEESSRGARRMAVDIAGRWGNSFGRRLDSRYGYLEIHA